MPPIVRVLRATQAALDKLGRRNISDDGAEQLPIEETLDPQPWLIVTGWDATAAERRILGDRR